MEIPYNVEVRKDTGLYNAKLGIWLFLAPSTISDRFVAGFQATTSFTILSILSKID